MPGMPKFTKSPPEVIAAFDAASPSRAGVERKSMFGYPALFVNGNMFAFTFGRNIVIRLDAPGRAKAVKAGAVPFEIMPGRPMAEYIGVAGAAMKGPALRRWLADGLAYAVTLPPRAVKGATSKAKSSGAKKVTATKPAARKT
jgi:hypothetical protein